MECRTPDESDVPYGGNTQRDAKSDPGDPDHGDLVTAGVLNGTGQVWDTR